MLAPVKIHAFRHEIYFNWDSFSMVLCQLPFKVELSWGTDMQYSWLGEWYTTLRSDSEFVALA